MNKIDLNKIKQISSKKKDYEYLHISYHKVYTYSMASYDEVEFLRLFATKSFLVIHKDFFVKVSRNVDLYS